MQLKIEVRAHNERSAPCPSLKKFLETLLETSTFGQQEEVRALAPAPSPEQPVWPKPQLSLQWGTRSALQPSLK